MIFVVTVATFLCLPGGRCQYSRKPFTILFLVKIDLFQSILLVSRFCRCVEKFREGGEKDIPSEFHVKLTERYPEEKSGEIGGPKEHI
jgi:hypothetical protein